MREVFRYSVVLIAAVISYGCSDSESASGPDARDVVAADAGISVEAFVGSWQASSHLYTNNANQAEQYDLIVNGGDSRMTVLSGGGARTWMSYGAFSDEWDAQLSVSGTILTSRPIEGSRPMRVYQFTLMGDQLTLTNASDDFDFTLSDAAPVSATVVIEFTRQ